MRDIKKEDLRIERLETLKNELVELENKVSELYQKKFEAGIHDPDLNWYRENIKPLKEQQEYVHCLIRRIERFNVQVGDGVTICYWSDQHAATVISRTAKSITVQRDTATLDPSFKPEFIVGGFAGHCTNQDEQTYTYERNPKGRIETYRWSNKYGQYRSAGDQSIKIINGRHEFYDYNF